MFFTSFRKPPPVCCIVLWARCRERAVQPGSCVRLPSLCLGVLASLCALTVVLSHRDPKILTARLLMKILSPHSCQNQIEIANATKRASLENFTHTHTHTHTHRHTHTRMQALLLGLATQWECKHVVNAVTLSWLPRWLKFNRFFPPDFLSFS